MKLLKTLSLLAATLVMSSTVSAQVSATKDVVVDATLTSACVFDSATAVNLTAVYPAFSTAAVEPEDSVTVQCTRGGGTPSVNFAGGTLGVVGGLVFQLSAAWANGVAGSAPAGALITDVGSPRTGTFTVKASFPAGQAGTTGATTPVTKEMTLTF
jgi:hypothetical protein